MQNLLVVCADKDLRKDLSRVLGAELNFLYVDVDDVLDFELLNQKDITLSKANDVLKQLERKSIDRVLGFKNCIITMSIKGFEGLDQPMPKTIRAERGEDNFGISEGMLEIVVPDITEYIEGNYSRYLIDDTQKKILNKNFFYLKDITQSSATICFVYLKKITCSTNVKVGGTEGGKSYWFDVSADRSFSAFATSSRSSKEEMVIGMGKNPFSLNSNDFFQSGTRKALSSPTSIGEDISLDILSEYENGLETATLRCEVGDYFYDDGEKAISIDNDELPMTFDNGMTVIPMIRSPQGVDVPMSVYSSSGNAKKFRIVGISMIYDGAVWQQITIKEIKE